MLTAPRRKIIIEFMKFGTIGVFGFALDAGLVYFGIYALGLSRVMAGLVSFPFTVTFTWFNNRIFTFRHAKRERIGLQWAKFLVVCAFGLVFNRGTYSFMVTYYPVVYAYPVLGLLAGTAAGMFFNFFAARRLVFR
jgi:putative flippase GtrA